MTKKQNLFIFSLIITISLFIYLTSHHYAVKLGIGGSSLCSISQKINCDAAALSSYSEVAKTPIALLGAVFNFFLLGLVLFSKLNWITSTTTTQIVARGMLAWSAAVSLAMGLISITLVKVICPFCLATYIFSFINLYLGWFSIEPETTENFSITSFFTNNKSYSIYLACIPLISWMISGMILENYGLSELYKIIPEKVEQWKSAQTNEFDLKTGLINRTESDKIVLIEFADFKCPHCKAASQAVDLFLKNRDDIKFIYKPFPLDGTCNASEQMQKGDGTRCKLATWTLCAEKLYSKGWDVHHWIFENQEQISYATDLNAYLPELEEKFNIKKDEFTQCSDSSEIYDLIKKSSAEGVKAQVNGTPSFYLNGKKLNYIHAFSEVLKAAISEIK